MALDRALLAQGLKRSDYARILGKPRSFVTRILDQHNFTLETLADAFFVLGYAVHFHVTCDTARMQAPVIEDDSPLYFRTSIGGTRSTTSVRKASAATEVA